MPESIHYKSLVDVSEFIIGGNIGDILYNGTSYVTKVPLSHYVPETLFITKVF